jgi:hypothetical protein
MGCIGCDTTINTNVVNKRKFSNDTQINNAQVNNEVNNFVNNLTANLNVSSIVTNAVQLTASNVFSLRNIKCDNINISNVNMSNDIVSSSNINVKQNITNNISNNIENIVKTTCQAAAPTPEFLQTIMGQQQKALNDFYKGTELDLDKIGKMGADMADAASQSGIGNDTTVNLNVSQETDVTNKLGISTSQTNNMANNSSTDTVVNTIVSAVIDSMTNISAANLFEIQNATCKNLNINTILQTNKIQQAFSAKMQTEAVQTVINKVANKISSSYSMSYDAAQKEHDDNMAKYNNPNDSYDYTEEHRKYMAALDAKLKNIQAMELQTMYTLCKGDPVLKCQMESKYRELGADIPLSNECIAISPSSTAKPSSSSSSSSSSAAKPSSSSAAKPSSSSSAASPSAAPSSVITPTTAAVAASSFELSTPYIVGIVGISVLLIAILVYFFVFRK